MREVWLKPNRRVLWIAALIPAAAVLLGVCLFLFVDHVAAWLGLVMVAMGLRSAVVLALEAARPRLAYEQGHLLVFVGSQRPIRVPIEQIEVFFLGQGPSELPQGDHKTANVVVRLAEAAKEWKQQEVSPKLANWSEGYITLKGAWVEPIQADLLRSLNEKLKAAHREQRQAEEPASP